MPATVSGGTGARIAAILRLTIARTVRPMPLVLGAVITALPILFAAIYRSTGGDDANLAEFLLTRYNALIVSMLLPLAALVMAAGATSAEREDGTILYLLTTTTSRALLAMVRWVFATLVTSVIVLLAVFGTGLLAGNGSDPTGVMRAFAIGSVVGAAVYSAVFLAMAVWLRRALLVGLLYVLVWEGTISSAVPAVKYLSARQVLLGITQRFVQPAEQGAGPFETVPGFGTSVAWALAVTALALAFTVFRLRNLPVTKPR
jgi:ABC-2 type transport system permease protein